MAKLEVLLAGATGFIGGTIVSTLAKSPNDFFEACNVSLLVRGADRARVFDQRLFKTVLFESLGDTAEIERIASNYDLIINTTPGPSTGSATAFIKGLGNRKKSTGREVYYIHTSGASDLADQPITNAYHDSQTFIDTSPSLYPYLQHREAQTTYPQRTTDIAVISTGLATDVKTYIIMPPTIYGTGTGHFNRLTIQVPIIMRSALKTGQVMQLAPDDGVGDHVHVQDLADLYLVVASRVVKDGMQGFPSGERGIYFAGTGRHRWGDFTQKIAQALREVDAIKTTEIKRIGLKEAADLWTGGDELLCELNFAASCRTQADTSRSLGWHPKKTGTEFDDDFLETAKLVVQSEK